MYGLAFLPNIGTTELIVLLVIGLLLFGRRLPEVGRSLGKGIVEFKKGLRGIEDEVDSADQRAKTNRAATLPATDAAAGQRLEQPNVQGQDVRVSRSDVVG
jgi:sec-independent protein translocase protein TatA